MEPLFQFLGNFWWLIFPVMGVVGGLGSAWERGARRRHRRRLEILKAKSELKAAQGSAKAIVPAASADPDPEETPAVRLQRVLAAHDDVTRRWLEYELDVAKLIAFPAMSDGRQPLTAAFLRAKKVADGLRPASAKARLSKDEFAEYRAAVTDYEVAFDVAERDARRLKDSSFTEAERKRLDTAQQLLTVAVDQAATPAERQLAYRRVRDELDGLISISDDAIEVLKEKVALELPVGTSADTANPTPSADVAPTPWPVPSRTTNARTNPPRATPPRPSTAPGRIIRPNPPHSR